MKVDCKHVTVNQTPIGPVCARCGEVVKVKPKRRVVTADFDADLPPEEPTADQPPRFSQGFQRHERGD